MEREVSKTPPTKICKRFGDSSNQLFRLNFQIYLLDFSAVDELVNGDAIGTNAQNVSMTPTADTISTVVVTAV